MILWIVDFLPNVKCFGVYIKPSSGQYKYMMLNLLIYTLIYFKNVTEKMRKLLIFISIPHRNWQKIKIDNKNKTKKLPYSIFEVFGGSEN